MKCEKCKGDGRMIGGLIDGPQVDGKPTKIPATGWGQCDACKGSGERTIMVVAPPDLATVMESGYSSEAAAVIVAEEAARAERGEKPYGPNDPVAKWGTPAPAVIPEPPPPAQAPAPPPVFALGQEVALISGGPKMIVTALLGDEVACEWPEMDPDGKEVGKQSRAFAVTSLKAVV